MDILIENVDGSVWAAAVKDRRMQAIEIDPVAEGVRWGSIHLAKVTRIDKRMNAAFVDLGHGEQGILQARDIRPKEKKEKPLGEILKTGDTFLVQAKNTTLPLDLHNDMVPEEHKLSRVSMDISIPGRFLIYLPFENEKKVSSRVKDKTIRDRMLKMMDNIETIDGCIMRASAANMQTDVLVRESKILKEIWEQLKTFTESGVPSLIMEGPNAIQRIIGDLATHAIDNIVTDDEALYAEVEEWCDIYAPDLMMKARFLDPEENNSSIGLFDQYDMIGEVQSLVQPYVVLPSGGNIIIQPTNALTVVDVNLGQGKSASDVNVEAAHEIIRQIRLRNIGGAVVIDFINIKQKKLKDEIIKILKEDSLNDPCTVDVHHFTALGLVELTRARRTPPLDTQFQINMAYMDDVDFE